MSAQPVFPYVTAFGKDGKTATFTMSPGSSQMPLPMIRWILEHGGPAKNIPRGQRLETDFKAWK